MSNFKSGSGNLDFGESDEEPSENDVVDQSETAEKSAEAEADSQKQASADIEDTDHDIAGGQSVEASSTKGGSATTGGQSSTGQTYPYFVRRSNVGDERDTRLELHVRDTVADQEAEFRANLADELGTSEVSKTDAREFALLAAFHHPERVAELMEDEGFNDLV
ncbi:acyl-CoA dehydrogenase [Halanaeroarchaeum sulfurireducens]|uniref:Acyl-CoA dehydrogenase n=1 Tax=Halanaeroarchaeum sulfurireducens TaxID=1604004 RepID=A0A0F7PD90_9EURY|nr:acyl-CoA dehydrogenase [Halanaeroarchaeum sulfurireducens]AKH98647.1 acyl-CoA dehydrogenase [Halanaeroarchaeum sulfurireducens]ALG83089.1 acyl-CoA dehydrogenase [Halanaeroarchaeum sulfurireducens]